VHELSLAQSMLAIVEQAARQGGFRRVERIRLEIGRISCVAPEALRLCIEAVARGSVAEGARLEILEIAGEGRCRQCGSTTPLDEPYGVCPDCGAPLDICAGNEMRVKDIDAA
jgi:hydrogenase nickel incorporation protein HypA/HybF